MKNNNPEIMLTTPLHYITVLYSSLAQGQLEHILQIVNYSSPFVMVVYFYYFPLPLCRAKMHQEIVIDTLKTANV